MILSQTYRPVSGDERRAQLLLRAKLLAEAVPAFRFRFPKSSAANDLLHRLFDEHLAR